LACVFFEAVAADASTVQAPIAALDAALISAMKAGASAFPERAALIKPALLTAFDLLAILRVSVGPGWAQLPPAQQTALSAAFEQFTIVTYTANFNKFSGERFDMLPALRTVGSDQVVQTRLVPASGAPTPLDYVMRQGDGGWKAVDVLLDGSISRVAVQRSDFRAQMKDDNPATLIESLRKKIATLSGGTLTS